MVGGHELRRHKANSGQNPGIPEKPPGLPEIPGRVRPTYAAHDAISLSPRARQRLLKYAHRSLCCRYACLKAAAAKRRARHADGSADDAVAMPTFCFKIIGGAWHALLRSQSAHRNEAAQQAGCCQQGPMLPHARIVQRGPAHTGFTPSPSHV